MPLEITLITLWFRNYPLITLSDRFLQLDRPFPVIVSVVPHFQVLHFNVLTFGPSFSDRAFSGISSLLFPHFQVLHFQFTQLNTTLATNLNP